MSPNTKSSVLTRWLASQPPPAAIEIDGRRVTAVALAGRGTPRTLTGYATEPVDAGAVEPGLNAPNVHDGAALSRAIRAAM